MGKNNQKRRAEKKRGAQHAKASGSGRAQTSSRAQPSGGSAQPDVLMLLHAAVRAAARGEPQWRGMVMEVADAAARMGRSAVAGRATVLFENIFCSLWEGGWQPAEVIRALRRSRRADHADLAVTVLAASEACGEPAPPGRPPAWSAQLEELGVWRWWGSDPDWLEPWAKKAGVDWPDALVVAVETLAALDLPNIEVLGPPPSAWGLAGAGARGPGRASGWAAAGGTTGTGGAVDDAVLARIRALLAKAESTSFEAEAEALSAKAQELMARHAIDEAVAQAASGEIRQAPVARRIAVDDPYASAKSYLLGAVATANGVRAVWYGDFAMMAVIGFDRDLDAVELLFTSLLVQATRAMLNGGSVTDRAGRSRTRSFRQSFLVAFASRIGERLREAAAAARAQAEDDLGMSLVPVLAGRAEEVDDTVSALFPRLKAKRGPTATNEAGWVAGRTAAELANLSAAHGTLAGSA
jgi:Protein of unknown function (DUF2786)